MLGVCSLYHGASSLAFWNGRSNKSSNSLSSCLSLLSGGIACTNHNTLFRFEFIKDQRIQDQFRQQLCNLIFENITLVLKRFFKHRFDFDETVQIPIRISVLPARSIEKIKIPRSIEKIRSCFTYKTSHLGITFLAVSLTPEVVISVFKVLLKETVIKIRCSGLFSTRSGVSVDSK